MSLQRVNFTAASDIYSAFKVFSTPMARRPCASRTDIVRYAYDKLRNHTGAYDLRAPKFLPKIYGIPANVAGAVKVGPYGSRAIVTQVQKTTQTHRRY